MSIGNIPYIGASIPRGISTAMKAAVEMGCKCAQVHYGSPRQWKAPVISDPVATKFRRVVDAGIIPAIHATYLINLASPTDAVRKKSAARLKAELLAAAVLDVPYLVMHPDAAGVTDNRDRAMPAIALGIDKAMLGSGNTNTTVLLETMTGSGVSIGGKFDDLAGIIAQSEFPERLGVCMDLCHVFSAGYDIRTVAGYEATIREFDNVIGTEKLKFVHLTDSKHPLGSHKDEHRLPGKGHLGLLPFKLIVNDERFHGIPMCIETHGGKNGELCEGALAAVRG